MVPVQVQIRQPAVILELVPVAIPRLGVPIRQPAVILELVPAAIPRLGVPIRQRVVITHLVHQVRVPVLILRAAEEAQVMVRIIQIEKRPVAERWALFLARSILLVEARKARIVIPREHLAK